ncbi:MAG: VWA domain-containing protein [Bacteroidales bacterium]|nr:VWA domain-containing protein [Bacteroidales bacterium]MCF8387750.1 VWA domain-containing protein [Bacteroidales bacterium]MCF8398314.1 VWA domain-containing protein [Bacteroidales bacterium]
MNLLRFENIEFLYALLMIPVFIIIFILMMNWKKRSFRKFGEWQILSQLIPFYSRSRAITKFFVLMLAYIFLVIGIANPQVGSKLQEVERKGIDIMIALDVSSSMLSEDIKPSRLERAKKSISDLIDGLSGDRIGIIIFAGRAYLQLPITTDYAAAKLFLSTISTDIVPTQGTAIGQAIEMAVNSFDDNDHSKAIIIITDGENHEGDAVEQARLAAEKDIDVYAIGMGLPEGAPIPIVNRYGNKVGYKKDRQGNTVITKLNETMLQQIASAGNGIYVTANNSSAGLEKIFEEIEAMEKTEFESRVFSDYEDRFQYFIAVAVLLLTLELIILDRKSKWSDKFRLFGH